MRSFLSAPFIRNSLVILGAGCATAAVGLPLLFALANSQSQGAGLGVIVVLIGFSPLVIRSLWSLARSGQIQVDLFSPAVGFSALFGLMYGTGVIRAWLLESGFNLPWLAGTVLLGLFGFYGGIMLANILWRYPGRQLPARVEMQWPVNRLYIITLLVASISAIIFVYTSQRTGIVVLSGNVETYRTQVVGIVGGYAFHLIRTMIVALYFGFVLLFVHRRECGVFRTLTVLLVLLVGSVILLATGYRNGVAIAAIGGIAVYNYFDNVISSRKLLSFAILLIIVLAAYGVWRAGTAELGASSILDRVWRELSLPFFTLQTVVSFFPSNLPFLHGHGMLMTFQALLPGSQPILGPWLKQQLGLSFPGGGFPPSIVGGLYLEWGTLGIFTGMLVVGLVIQSVYVRMRKKPTEYWVLFYSFVMTYMLQAIRDGLLKDFFPFWFLIVLTACHLIMTRIKLSPSQASATGPSSTPA